MRPGGSRRPPPENFETVSPARLEAARALYRIENGAKSGDALASPSRLKPEDEALLRELVYGSTRQKRLLDHHLGSLCKTPFSKLPPEVKIALRLGLYQLLFLNRVPARAAVHESVNLVKKAGQEKLCGFVNAVLRTAEDQKAGFRTEGNGETDTLALRTSHPTWMVKRWAERMSPEKLEQILRSDNLPHAVFLHVRPGSREKVVETLKSQDISAVPAAWPAQALRVTGRGSGLFSGESFRQGDWIVQDWTPQAMLELLPLLPGQKAWDVCAAPGGKTVGLAWRVGEKGQVIATDASEERRKVLVENLARIGAKQAVVYEGSLSKLTSTQKFDWVWVDAPCSGTAVLSRRADLRWRLSLKDLTALVPRQWELLEQGGGHVYPGGCLVYSTCSLEPEENEEIVRRYLQAHPDFSVIWPDLPPEAAGVEKREEGFYFWPTGEHDGGFCSILRKTTA